MFQRSTRLAVNTVLGVPGVVAFGYTMWGLTDDCKSSAESDDSKKTGNKCVVGAITTTISIIGFALKLKTFIIDFAVEIKVDVMVVG